MARYRHAGAAPIPAERPSTLHNAYPPTYLPSGARREVMDGRGYTLGVYRLVSFDNRKHLL